jgi:hypothetical protein
MSASVIPPGADQTIQQINVRSNFLTSSDVTTYIKRNVIAKTFFNEINEHKNWNSRYASYVTTSIANNENKVGEIGRGKLAPATQLFPVTGTPCCSNSYTQNIGFPIYVATGPRIYSLRPYP